MTAAAFANPYAHADVVGERIDQGLDAAGTGTLGAIARGVVTKVVGASSGWPGNYVEYKVTQPGPLFGQSIFYAEGVRALVKPGDVVNAGDPVAQLIPGWSTGTETGFAAGGGGTSAYAAAHGGYVEGKSTAAGEAWAKLVAGLGGPKGHTQPGGVIGQAPSFASQGGPSLSAEQAVSDILSGNWGALVGQAGATDPIGTLNTIGQSVDTAAQAAQDTVAIAGDISSFVSNPGHALLTVGLVAAGALLIYSGTGRMLGFNAPVTSTAKRATSIGKAAAE